MEKKGIAAAKGELTQLHVMDTWVPKDPTMLSRADKVKALSSLMFLKEKSSGKVKGRSCMNVVPQRSYISKEDALSPTVVLLVHFHQIMCGETLLVHLSNVKNVFH